MREYPDNFSRGELLRSVTARRHGIDNTPVNEDVEDNLVQLAWTLQTIRDDIRNKTGAARPISVSSGYRCPRLNGVVTGSNAGKSRHMYGLAADIVVHGWTPYEAAVFISDHMPYLRFHKAINEYGEWLHLSIPHPNEHQSKKFLTADNPSGKRTRWRGGVFDV